MTKVGGSGRRTDGGRGVDGGLTGGEVDKRHTVEFGV